jgi:hypothetical protein
MGSKCRGVRRMSGKNLICRYCGNEYSHKSTLSDHERNRCENRPSEPLDYRKSKNKAVVKKEYTEEEQRMIDELIRKMRGGSVEEVSKSGGVNVRIEGGVTGNVNVVGGNQNSGNVTNNFNFYLNKEEFDLYDILMGHMSCKEAYEFLLRILRSEEDNHYDWLMELGYIDILEAKDLPIRYNRRTKSFHLYQEKEKEALIDGTGCVLDKFMKDLVVSGALLAVNKVNEVLAESGGQDERAMNERVDNNREVNRMLSTYRKYNLTKRCLLKLQKYLVEV